MDVCRREREDVLLFARYSVLHSESDVMIGAVVYMRYVVTHTLPKHKWPHNLLPRDRDGYDAHVFALNSVRLRFEEFNNGRVANGKYDGMCGWKAT